MIRLLRSSRQITGQRAAERKKMSDCVLLSVTVTTGCCSVRDDNDAPQEEPIYPICSFFCYYEPDTRVAQLEARIFAAVKKCCSFIFASLFWRFRYLSNHRSSFLCLLKPPLIFGPDVFLFKQRPLFSLSTTGICFTPSTTRHVLMYDFTSAVNENNISLSSPFWPETIYSLRVSRRKKSRRTITVWLTCIVIGAPNRWRRPPGPDGGV